MFRINLSWGPPIYFAWFLCTEPGGSLSFSLEPWAGGEWGHGSISGRSISIIFSRKVPLLFEFPIHPSITDFTHSRGNGLLGEGASRIASATRVQQQHFSKTSPCVLVTPGSWRSAFQCRTPAVKAVARALVSEGRGSMWFKHARIIASMCVAKIAKGCATTSGRLCGPVGVVQD